jgi:hypothetical protein
MYKRPRFIKREKDSAEVGVLQVANSYFTEASYICLGVRNLDTADWAFAFAHKKRPAEAGLMREGNYCLAFVSAGAGVAVCPSCNRVR